MPYLLHRGGLYAGQRFALAKERTKLGREPLLADLVINDNNRNVVSREHAVISCDSGRYFIEDGDGKGKPSKFGTIVNGERLPCPGRVPLRNGDTIKLCDFTWTFHDDDINNPTPRYFPAEPEEQMEQDTSSSIKASISHSNSSVFLQTQPAARLKILLEVSNLLSRTLELHALWPPLLEKLFQLFPQADRGFAIRCIGTPARLQQELAKTRRPGDEVNVRFSGSLVRQSIEKLEAFLGGEGAKDLPSSESVIEAAIRSVMVAPLWSQDGKPLGALQLDTRDARRAFTADDLNLLLGVASQASIAVDNARLHQQSLAQERLRRDLETARNVVASFQPLELPRLAGYEFFAHYAPAEDVGGDYYDFVPLPGGRLAVLLGDVAGKGVPAALIMVRFTVEVKNALLTVPDPTAAFARLNGAMQQLGKIDRFVTLTGVVLDPATHTATLVNAGHPPPLLLRPGTPAVEAAPRAASGPAIGLFPEAAYSGNPVQLAAGDCLVLFSDGVTDAQNAAGRQLGRKGIEDALKDARPSPRESGQRILDAVSRHAAGCSQSDDITLVAFGRDLP